MATAQANQTCPCLTSLASFGVRGIVKMRIDSTNHNYGATYGLHECFPHDANRPPLCNSKESHCFLDGHTSVTDLASRLYCFDPWCYVNRSECDLPSAATGSGGYAIIGLKDPSLELHYSYATCGNLDKFDTNQKLRQLQAFGTLRVSFPGNSGSGYTVTDALPGSDGAGDTRRDGSVIRFFEATMAAHGVPWVEVPRRGSHNSHRIVCTQHSMPLTAVNCVCYR